VPPRRGRYGSTCAAPRRGQAHTIGTPLPRPGAENSLLDAGSGGRVLAGGHRFLRCTTPPCFDLTTILTSLRGRRRHGWHASPNGYLERRARHQEQLVERETRRGSFFLGRRSTSPRSGFARVSDCEKDGAARRSTTRWRWPVYYKWLAHLFEHGELPPAPRRPTRGRGPSSPSESLVQFATL